MNRQRAQAVLTDTDLKFTWGNSEKMGGSSSPIKPPRVKEEDAEEKQTPEQIPTPPPVEEDEYTLTAFGDISLSNIDFVPGPPGLISPARDANRKKEKKLSPVHPKLHKHDDLKAIPAVIKRVLPPSPSKARVVLEDISFDEMVMNLRRSREAEKLDPPSKELSSVQPAPRRDEHSAQQKRLVGLENFGTEAGVSIASSHDVVVENNVLSKRAIPGVQCAGSGVSAPIAIRRRKKVALRGDAKLPRRPPIPRWDIDSRAGSGGTGVPCHLGITSRYQQLT